MRNEGKTQWMLAQLVSAVLEGQPQSIVVAHTHDYAAQLRSRAARMLAAMGERPILFNGDVILLDESIILFTVPSLLQPALDCHRGAGVFWDHKAEEDVALKKGRQQGMMRLIVDWLERGFNDGCDDTDHLPG